MPDKLEQEIEKAREEFWDAESAATEAIRKKDVAEARLEALELAAKLRPTHSIAGGTIIGKSISITVGAPKGRQPGAISKQWRSILLRMSDTYPIGATDEEIAIVARDVGLTNTRAKDARDRMSDYTSYGYVEQSARGWRVTETALQRFKDIPSSESDGGQSVNEEEQGETSHSGPASLDITLP